MSVTENDVLEVAARLEYSGGEDVVNAYHIRYQSPGIVTDAFVADDILTLMEQIYTIIISIINVTTIFRDIRIKNKTTDTLMGTYAWPTLQNGTAVGEELPHGVSQMVSFPTSVPRVTLRKFLTRGIETGLTPPGVWGAAALAVQASFGASMLLQKNINQRLYQYGYFSPKTQAFERPVAALVTNVPAYQRRRKPGRGS